MGSLVESAVKIIRKAESWLCPCRRMGLRAAEQRVPLFGSLFELYDSRMEINKSHSETDKCSWVLENQVAKSSGDRFPPSLVGKRKPWGQLHVFSPICFSSPQRAVFFTDFLSNWEWSLAPNFLAPRGCA